MTNKDDAIYFEMTSYIFSDLENEIDISKQQPLLAHYTSLNVIESILRNDEIWFSNPLKMNDIEEFRFGINNGRASILDQGALRSELGERRYDLFCENFTG